MAKGILGQPAPGSSAFQVALILSIAMGALILIGLSGCDVGAPTPATGTPGIGLESVATPTGSPMPGRGPESTTSIYPVTPEEADLAPSPTAGAAIEAHESPETHLVTPTRLATRPARASATPTQAGADRESPGPVEVVAPEAESRASAQDVLGVSGAPEEPAAPGPNIPAGTATAHVNIRGGPGTSYPILGLLEAGQSVEITGVSPDGGWWQMRFAAAADERGWVSAAYISARNTENVPVVKPPALPLAPVTVTGWRGEYFANRDLAGKPAQVRDDPQLSFDWEASAPADGLPVDDFSVRWTRGLDFSAGTYRFYAHVDDGVRLWIDGTLAIDQWHDSAPTTYTADVPLAEGKHDLLMEYFEHTGNAVAQLAWEPLQDYPDWRGEYYDNHSLSGAPVLVRNDPSIDFYWDVSPGPGVPADNFSARWTRSLYFPAYVYRFNLVVDDGARLWLDDRLIIDGWRSGPAATYSTELGLSEGTHTLKLEYFEFRYGAQLYLNWEPVQDGPTWDAEYFDNRRLKDDPVLERDDGLINFIWGTGSPGQGVPADDFSARWKQEVRFDEGSYVFSVVVDDGARLWVDDVLLIDRWQEGRVRLLQAEHYLSQGRHRVKVEYFEHTGHAQIEVSWERQ
jgi:uncharacterized protein YraI